MSPALEIKDLSVAYHRKPVLTGISMRVMPGSMVGIIGPNGAGKSTFVKAVMGLLPVMNGSVKVFGESFADNLHRVGYVPQRESVDWDFPVDVLDVVLMGRYGKIGIGRRPSAGDREVAMACLEKVQMTPFASRQIGDLSGGQQQRVFLARALAQESDLYLMDEPFAGVDAATEAAIVGILSGLREAGKTILVVHHDLASAGRYFDHLMLLNERLIGYGPTQGLLTRGMLQMTYGGKLNLFPDSVKDDPSQP